MAGLAKIIALFNKKGGVGKTTYTLWLAATTARMGKRVAVVELDSQESIRDILAERDVEEHNEFPVTTYNYHQYDKSLADKLGELATHFDYIFIDCPPSEKEEITARALEVTDLVVVPTIVSKQSLLATKVAMSLINNVRINVNPELKSVIFINEYDKRTLLGQVIPDELEAEFPETPVLKTKMPSRQVIKKSEYMGLSPHEMGDSDSKLAEKDIKKLHKEIFSYLK
ncbi:ParA family protein [Hydrogenovibrio marinus]|uniref:CobQ/CobB/MinD/ParA nucleotide binding domain-containing protein n=1 Tax=Hydrogenovibrio marinus TaxID=28885 RepID=A0A066ZX32_HYDMR|nr:ParA family protein [Hydrogenovibrio marinus]KDN94645.1 hypothetical protein EI16_12150 [Hydrogenovibrio marinus]